MQANALLNRPLLDARMQANPAAAGLALADVQLLLDRLQLLLFCALTLASPLLDERLDVDDRLTLHHLTDLVSAIVVDPGHNQTETMLRALSIELGLILRDA